MMVLSSSKELKRFPKYIYQENIFLQKAILFIAHSSSKKVI